MTSDLEELEAKMGEPTFWNDTRSTASVSKSTLERELTQWREVEAKIDDLQALLELAEESRDESLERELTAGLNQFEPKLAAIRVEMLLSGELDTNNALVAIHPGAGGTESQDWAQMLLRMYVRWAETRNSKSKPWICCTATKPASSGDHLRHRSLRLWLFEGGSGVHLVRISRSTPTNAAILRSRPSSSIRN
ncbi:MAG: PCRF domain-containing protein [Nitrospira sp.]